MYKINEAPPSLWSLIKINKHTHFNWTQHVDFTKYVENPKIKIFFW